MTGIALESTDARATRDELKAADVDAELMGGDGFFFRDHEGNQLLIVQPQERA